MARKIRLSESEWAILAFCEQFFDEHGRMPSSGEIHSDRCTIPRPMLVRLLWTMEKKGFIKKPGRHWREGWITEAGYRALEEGPLPQARRKVHRGGLAPDGGTRFKSTLFRPTRVTALSWGVNNPKLGDRVRKARKCHPARNQKIMAVALEEGRTCPLTCQLRATCYMGSVPFAKRVRWDGEETTDVIAAAIRQAGPVMVRLHTSGDFPSVRYTQEVYQAICDSGSAAFGYTHWPPESEIGSAIARIAREDWLRFAIRFSYRAGQTPPQDVSRAVVVPEKASAAAHNALVCPEQTKQVSNCGSCGYCWNSQEPVAFLEH